MISISVCKHAEVDLVFVLDYSGSVKAGNFTLVKKFTKDFLRDADIDGGSVRVGVIVYSTDNKVAFNLNNFSSKAQVFNAIDAIPFKGGKTNTGSALETMRSEMFTVVNGDRPDVDNVAIVITDGESHDNPISVADLARDDGIDIFAIGIGGANQTELEGIANKPSAQNVFTVEDFAGLDGLDKKVFTSVCSKSINYFVIIFHGNFLKVLFT